MKTDPKVKELILKSFKEVGYPARWEGVVKYSNGMEVYRSSILQCREIIELGFEGPIRGTLLKGVIQEDLSYVDIAIELNTGGNGYIWTVQSVPLPDDLIKGTKIPGPTAEEVRGFIDELIKTGKVRDKKRAIALMATCSGGSISGIYKWADGSRECPYSPWALWNWQLFYRDVMPDEAKARMQRIIQGEMMKPKGFKD